MIVMQTLIEPTAASVRTVAKLLECSPRHVERLDAAGKIPAPVRLGRAKRWNLDELRRWVAAGCPDRQTWTAQKESA